MTPSKRRRRLREGVLSIHCGGYSTFVVTMRGAVYACGLNNYGQLGVGHADNVYEMEEVEGLRGKGVVAIAAGLHHTLALTRAGHVFAFGRGDSGQLGLRGASGGDSPPPVGACSYEPLQVRGECYVRV